MDMSTPAFLQGFFSFTGSGLDKPEPLKGATYSVPFDKRAQMVYFRAGNSTRDLVTLILLCDGKQTRLFPIGGRASLHVSMAVTEDLAPDSKISLQVAAKEGKSGTVVVDIGFIEI